MPTPLQLSSAHHVSVSAFFCSPSTNTRTSLHSRRRPAMTTLRSGYFAGSAHAGRTSTSHFLCFYSDEPKAEAYGSIACWLNVKKLDSVLKERQKQRLGFIDEVFNYPMIICTGCNQSPCVCHYKLALSELLRNGKRQITGGNH